MDTEYPANTRDLDMTNKTKKRFWFDFSVWVVISAIAVMAIVFAVMALAHFQRQKEQAVELLTEKGATLIRSFEAGLRSSSSIKEGTFGLQKLLIETAQQPDIDYIIVAASNGNIIADSDPSQVGDKYGLDLDGALIALSKEIHWRQVTNPGGAGTFEVYRGFFPREKYTEDKTSPKGKAKSKRINNLIIYVGLDMAAIEKATKEDTRNTIIIALILLLIGSSAIVSLFLAQAYRLTRTSLSRIKVFSEALVKNMPIGLIALDNNDQIIACNEKAQVILNVACSDALGKQASAILPRPLKNLLKELPAQGGLLERDINLTSPDGEDQIWEIIAAGLMDEGIPAGRILLVHNATAIRQLEKEVTKSRHLTSIGSLAAGVAHEIRNPLSSIKGFAVYLKEKLSGNIEDKKTAEVMIQEIERLNRVISQLIEFARPLELKKEKTRISDLIRHIVKLIDTEARKNKITVEMEIDNGAPLIEVDPDKIKQVLLNIFLNSLVAMKNGGKLEIMLTPEKENLCVVIADTGAGINEMDLPRIYDPYFTSKPAGTGLGLAVVQKIMEAHGGHIKIESTGGLGTKVFLLFPLSDTGKKRNMDEN
jgi:two-component system sensor histidine kinase HydH